MKPKFTNSENLLVLVLAIIGIQAIVSCSSGLEGEDPNPSNNLIEGNSSSGGSSSSYYDGSSSVVTIMYGDDFTDTRSGGGNKTYKTVVIGSQTWMAENLNYAVAGSKCGGTDGWLTDANTVNCDKYGRLYDWETAMKLPNCNSKTCTGQVQAKHQGVCPGGWHIPSNDEWSILINYVDGTGGNERRDSPTAGKILKTTSGWNDKESINGNGTDARGFAALPGGSGIIPKGDSGDFGDVGVGGYWWSTFDGGYYAHIRYMVYGYEGAYWYSSRKEYPRSVRCVKD